MKVSCVLCDINYVCCDTVSYLRNGSVHRSSATHSAFVLGLYAHRTKSMFPAERYGYNRNCVCTLYFEHLDNEYYRYTPHSLFIPISSRTCLSALFCSTSCFACIARFRAEFTCLSLLQIIKISRSKSL